jgi:hypothetical protein
MWSDHTEALAEAIRMATAKLGGELTGKTGANEMVFNCMAENLQKTLEEMKVPQPLISEVMTIAASTKDAVLNRKPAGK